jgi:hypothetical protein
MNPDSVIGVKAGDLTSQTSLRDPTEQKLGGCSLCKSFNCCTKLEGLISKGFSCADVMDEMEG